MSLQGLREEWWTPNIMPFQSATETFQVASFPLYFMGGSPIAIFSHAPPPQIPPGPLPYKTSTVLKELNVHHLVIYVKNDL